MVVVVVAMVGVFLCEEGRCWMMMVVVAAAAVMMMGSVGWFVVVR